MSDSKKAVTRPPDAWGACPSQIWLNDADSNSPAMVLPDMWSRMLAGNFCYEGGTSCNPRSKDNPTGTGLHALQEQYWLSLPICAQPLYGGSGSPEQLAFGRDQSGNSAWNIGYSAPIIGSGPLEIPAYVPYFITKRIENSNSGFPSGNLTGTASDTPCGCGMWEKSASRLQDFMQLVQPAGIHEGVAQIDPLVHNKCYNNNYGQQDDISWWKECWTVFDKYGNIFNVDSETGLPFDPKRNPAQFLWIENEVTRPFRLADTDQYPYFTSSEGTDFPVFANNSAQNGNAPNSTPWMHGYGDTGNSSYIQNLYTTMNAQKTKDTIDTEYDKLSAATKKLLNYTSQGADYWDECKRQLKYLSQQPIRIIGYPCVTGLTVTTGQLLAPIVNPTNPTSMPTITSKLCKNSQMNDGGGKPIDRAADCTAPIPLPSGTVTQTDVEFWWDTVAARTGRNDPFWKNSLNSRGNLFTSALSRYPTPDFSRYEKWKSFELNPTLSQDCGWILYKSYPKLWMKDGSKATTPMPASTTIDSVNNPYWTGKVTDKTSTAYNGSAASRLNGFTKALITSNVASCVSNLFASENDWYADRDLLPPGSDRISTQAEASMWLGQNSTAPVYFILYNPTHRANLDQSTAPQKLPGYQPCGTSGSEGYYGCEPKNSGITGTLARPGIADYPIWSAGENYKGYPCPAMSTLRQQLLNNYYQSLVPHKAGPYWDNGVKVKTYSKPPISRLGDDTYLAGGYNPDPSALCCMTVAAPWAADTGLFAKDSNGDPRSFGNGWFSYVRSEATINVGYPIGEISITVLNQYQYGSYICSPGSALEAVLKGITLASTKSAGTGTKGNVYNTYMCSAPNCFQNANGGVWSPCTVGSDSCKPEQNSGSACGTKPLGDKKCSDFSQQECMGGGEDGVYPCTWNIEKGQCQDCSVPGKVFGMMSNIYPTTSMLFKMMYTSQWTGVGNSKGTKTLCTDSAGENINICNIGLQSAGSLSWTGSANCGGGTQGSQGQSSTGSLPCTTTASKGLQSHYTCETDIDCHGWACINGEPSDNLNPSFGAQKCLESLSKSCLNQNYSDQPGVQVVYPDPNDKSRGICQPCGNAGQKSCEATGGYQTTDECFKATGFPSAGKKIIYKCQPDTVEGVKCVSALVPDDYKLKDGLEFTDIQSCLSSTCYKTRHKKSGGDSGGGDSGGGSPKKSNTKLIIIIVCSVVGAILLAVGGYFLFRPHHSKTSTNSKSAAKSTSLPSK